MCCTNHLLRCLTNINILCEGLCFSVPGVNTNRQKQRLEGFRRKIEIHRKEVRRHLQVRDLEVQLMSCPGSALQVSQLTKIHEHVIRKKRKLKQRLKKIIVLQRVKIAYDRRRRRLLRRRQNWKVDRAITPKQRLSAAALWQNIHRRRAERCKKKANT